MPVERIGCYLSQMSFLGSIILITLYLISVGLAEDECPARFRRHPNPTACIKTQPRCQILEGATEWKIHEVLHVFNSMRNKIASGEYGFPAAADMMQWEWDDELAVHAQKYAESCGAGSWWAWTPDYTGIGYNGIDGHFVWGSWTYVIELLYKDLKATLDDPSPTEEEIDAFLADDQKSLILGRAWTVGAGWAKIHDSNYFLTLPNQVGRFFFGWYGSDHLDSQRYTRGKAASRCPNNTKPSTKYPALCKSLTKFGPTDIDIPAIRDSADTLYFCDFAKKSLCGLTIAHSAKDRVNTIETDRYNYLSILIRGGEKAKITFPKSLDACAETCLNVDFAHGPSVHGTKRASVVTVQHASGRKILGRKTAGNLWGVGSMIIELEEGKNLIWSISSPAGSPEEFFEVRRIIISDDLSLCN